MGLTDIIALDSSVKKGFTSVKSREWNLTQSISKRLDWDSPLLVRLKETRATALVDKRFRASNRLYG